MSSSYVKINVDDPLDDEFMCEILNIFSSTNAMLKSGETSDSSVPSAPNSMAFRAMVSGKVEFISNYIHHDNYSGTQFRYFLKIGNGMSVAHHKAGNDLFSSSLSALLGNQKLPEYITNLVVTFNNGYKLCFRWICGTAWNGVGVSIERH